MLGCQPTPPHGEAPDRIHRNVRGEQGVSLSELNIGMLVSDTLRRDHMGYYGNGWIKTPMLDRFSDRADTFDHAYPASFPTVPTRADLMTGRFTFSYLGWVPLPQTEITLSQLLTEAGYRTAAVVDMPFALRRGYGYDRGFEDFQWNRGQLDRPERHFVTSQWRLEEDRCLL